MNTVSEGWALVLEDEPRLQGALLNALQEFAPDLGPYRAASSAEDALVWCTSQPPTLAFVDIRLPGLSGIEFAMQLPDEVRVVFVTAHDEYAVQAFDKGAVDYLLKPISEARLRTCLNRLRSRDEMPLTALSNILRSLPSPSVAPLQWLTATSERRTRLIPVEDVVYLQADNRYTRVVCRDAEHLIEAPLKGLLARLATSQFLQIHRSTVVSLREVLLVERDDRGGGQIHLRSCKDVLRISAPYLRCLKGFLEGL